MIDGKKAHLTEYLKYEKKNALVNLIFPITFL